MFSGFSSGFISNCVAGLASAVVVLLVQKLYSMYWAWKTFSPMAGEYEEYTMPTGAATTGTINIRSIGARLITQGIKNDGHVMWTGVINMNPLSPNVGHGVYNMVGKFDCGTHHLQRDPETNDFVVMGSNTSHPDGKERFNLLWRRRRPKP
jgi:hypothetical protein